MISHMCHAPNSDMSSFLGHIANVRCEFFLCRGFREIKLTAHAKKAKIIIHRKHVVFMINRFQLSYHILIFTHLNLRLATATHNFMRVKIFIFFIYTYLHILMFKNSIHSQWLWFNLLIKQIKT